MSRDATTSSAREVRSIAGSLVGLLVSSVTVGLVGCEPGPSEMTEDRGRRALAQVAEVELETLPRGPFDTGGEVFLSAPWGNEEQAFERELVAAHTGPMALAALADGGLAVLDTVGGRVHRFDAQGHRRDVVPIGVETGDDLVALPAGGFAVLAYRRLPSPSHEVLAFDGEGTLGSRIPVPRSVSLPTALLADGHQLFVENRHRYVHPLDGSPWLTGRPAGAATITARRTEQGGLLLTATDRRGAQRLWQRELSAARPITEIFALEVAADLICVALRFVQEGDFENDDPGEHDSWLVTFDREGRPRGRMELRDRLVADANRPLALNESGDLFELVTTSEGVVIHRHALSEGGAR